MRLTTVILIASLVQVSAATFGQRITLKRQNTPLSVILTEIRKQSGYDIFYDNKLISKNQKVSVMLADVNVEEALKTVLKDLDLTYEINNKDITVKKKEPSFLDRVVAAFVDITVYGRVIDAEGKPIPGATVKVKGTNKTAVTTQSGSFTLKNVDENAVISISYIGFSTREVKAEKNMGDIRLEVGTSDLDEVVINKGYYTENRKLSTGSVGKVSAEEIARQPVSNPLQAIYAKIPGVIVSQQSGMSDGAINIQIRGQNSLRNTPADNGNYPLYIIDGVPYSTTPLTTQAGSNLYPQGLTTTNARGSSPFSALNPNDIESIEILKDADATAIYGSRGANGVVLITTKKGKSGTMKVDANIYTGAGQVTRKLKLLNTSQYLEMRKEAYANDNITTYPVDAYDVNGTWGETNNHDWQEELIGGTSRTTDAQLSFSGGSNTSQYRFGGGYHRESSVFPGDFANQRASGQLNLTNKSLNNKFQSQVSISYSLGINNMPAQDLTALSLAQAPNLPNLIDDNGNLLWATGVFTNVYAGTKQPYKSTTGSLIANSVFSYEILRGLTAKANLGYTVTNMNEILKTPISSRRPTLPAASLINTTNFGRSKSNNWIIEPQLSYTKAVKKHSFSALLGTTFQNENRDQLYQTANGFSSEALMDNISAVPNTSVFNVFSASEYRYNAVFGRLNYTYNNKYVLNITGRRDGSSRFGPGKQFANFGAIGAAWNFTEETFAKAASNILSYGKLRGSYGTTGSDQIAHFGKSGPLVSGQSGRQNGCQKW